jgi:hypothetical protein
MYGVILRFTKTGARKTIIAYRLKLISVNTARIYFLLWLSSGTRDLNVKLLGVYELPVNLGRKKRTFLSRVNENAFARVT